MNSFPMLQNLKYLIVDDSTIDRMSIEAEASRFPFLVKLASCSHALEAVEVISKSQPDIIFTDIEMPDINGLELIRNMAGKIAAPVFITSHPEFALNGFELEAFDYILKPFNSERFSRCALRLNDFFQLKQKAFAFEKEEEENFIVIKQGYDKYKIAIHDIIYLEAMKDYTKIVTETGPYLLLGTLSGVLTKLPSKDFRQVHRSFIINIQKINAVRGNKVILQEYELPVGKFYKHTLSEII